MTAMAILQKRSDVGEKQKAEVEAAEADEGAVAASLA